MSGLVPIGGAAFDYAALTDNVAAAAREAAARIRERVRGQQVAIFDIGRDLLTMKEALGHGKFLAWIGAEFGMTDRTARSYMQVANVLGLKSEIVSDLPPTVLYALAAPSTPPEIRDEVIGQIEAGDPPPPDQVKERIRAARHAEKERRADAKRTPAQKAYRRRAEKSAELEERASQKRVAEREAVIAETVGVLTDRFGADLPTFVALLKRVDVYYLREALEAAVAAGADAVPEDDRERDKHGLLVTDGQAAEQGWRVMSAYRRLSPEDRAEFDGLYRETREPAASEG